MEAHLEYTEHGRVPKRNLEETFGDYSRFSKLKGGLIRWYSESDMELMSPSERRSRVVLWDDVNTPGKDLSAGWYPGRNLRSLQLRRTRRCLMPRNAAALSLLGSTSGHW